MKTNKKIIFCLLLFFLPGCRKKSTCEKKAEKVQKLALKTKKSS